MQNFYDPRLRNMGCRLPNSYFRDQPHEINQTTDQRSYPLNSANQYLIQSRMNPGSKSTSQFNQEGLNLNTARVGGQEQASIYLKNEYQNNNIFNQARKSVPNSFNRGRQFKTEYNYQPNYIQNFKGNSRFSNDPKNANFPNFPKFSNYSQIPQFRDNSLNPNFNFADDQKVNQYRKNTFYLKNQSNSYYQNNPRNTQPNFHYNSNSNSNSQIHDNIIEPRKNFNFTKKFKHCFEDNSFDNSSRKISNCFNGMNEIMNKNEDQDDIKKWLAQRLKNFPTKTKVFSQINSENELKRKGIINKAELSKLEEKLRKKLILINGQLSRKNKRRNRKQKNIRNTHETNLTNEAVVANLSKEKIVQNELNNILAIDKPIESKMSLNQRKDQMTDELNFVSKSSKISKKSENFENLGNHENHENLELPGNPQNSENPGNPENPEKLIKDKKRRKGKDRYKNYFKYKQNELLKNLLKREINQEQNILLQCFRYFVSQGMV